VTTPDRDRPAPVVEGQDPSTTSPAGSGPPPADEPIKGTAGPAESGAVVARRTLLLPAVLFILALSLFPLLFSVALSFGQWDIGGAEGAYTWRGFSNYQQLFGDGRYHVALLNTIIYVLIGVSAQFLLGMGVAWLLYHRPPGHRFFQVTFLLPMMLAPVAVGYMWRLMFQQRIGVVNALLEAIGLDGVAWLSQAHTAMAAVLVAETWQWTPFVFLFLYAALLNVPTDPIEAARVDGATRWQIFRHVVFPMIRPMVIAVLILRGVESMKIMDTVYVMTRGGPGNSTESLTLYAYRIAMRFFETGYASAVAFTLLLLVLITVVPIVMFLKRDVEMTAS
jgi:multiple sugar transport system permease protein